jgi:hypothetical protein
LCVGEPYRQLKELSLIVIGCHTTLRSFWCHIFVLKVHALREVNIFEVKNRFCEELERVFDIFAKYHMKILFWINSLNST